MRFHAVGHPKALSSSTWQGVLRRLREAGREVEIHCSDYAGHSVELARALSPADDDVVVSVGGDGTFNEVINGLIEVAAPRVGVVSLGTGNDFARALEIPTDAEGVARRLLEPTPTTCDLGLVEAAGLEKPRHFALSITTGFSAAVTKRVASMPRGLPGTGIYLLSLLLELASWKTGRGTALVDGEHHTISRLFNLNVANTKFYGGGMYAAPKAQPSDGELDLVVMELTMAGVVRSLPENYRGRFERVPGVWQKRCREVEVESPKPLVVQADGEVLGTTPARITVLPGALTLMM